MTEKRSIRYETGPLEVLRDEKGGSQIQKWPLYIKSKGYRITKKIKGRGLGHYRGGELKREMYWGGGTGRGKG